MNVHLESLELRSLMAGPAAYGPWPLAPDSLLVRFADSAPGSSRQAVLSGLGATAVRTFPDGPTLLSVAAGSGASALAILRARPDVLYAEADTAIAPLAAIPNDPSFGSQWGLNQTNDVDVDAPQAWDVTAGKTSTVVAVTDTGIDYTHPDLYLNVAINQREIPTALRGSLVDTDADGIIGFVDLNHSANAAFVGDFNANARIDAGDLLADSRWADRSDQDGNRYVDDLTGWNFTNASANPWDGHSHGTHVSGIIAARTNNGVGVAGVAGNVRILPLKWIGDGGTGSLSAAASAIYAAVDQGAKVINASWGGGSSAIRDAIAYAGTKGVVFVASAGNSTTNTDVTPHYPSGYPLANIVSVAALTSSGGLASFSNYGATSVDLGAPGSSVYSTVPGGYGNKSGTSMAAPFVAGAISLLAGEHPDWTAAQLVNQVLSTTKPRSSLVGKTVTGGMLSASAALLTPASEPPPAPEPVVRASVTNLTATATSTSSIRLDWTPLAGVSGYRVERSLNGTSGWTVLGVATPTASLFVNTGLAANTTYYYRVVALYNGDEAAPSNIASARTMRLTNGGGKK